ncbi:hypothetical protein [Hymenobacter norwichensis]|uniref:hypothetical protein n=1 Tax=Hymenobacter norwichensis TaxID=223903 RepID=UPI00146D2A9A|nr:hypothetical protein [Hymenobacter norwichensis]
MTTTAEPVVDIWPYVDAISIDDLAGYALADDGLVQHVYQHPERRFLHVLVSTNNADVFLVVIIDLSSVEIYGHYLLNLLELYQVTPEFDQ